MNLAGQRYVPLEWHFISTVSYDDPFNDVDVDVKVEDATGRSWMIPAFWQGGNTWTVRFSAPKEGSYTYKSICTSPTDAGLHDQTGQIEISAYSGTNPLYVHGPIQIMQNQRYFEYADGTPFPWLGDTWHPLMTSRINNSDEVELLAKDREEKGYTFIEFINGFLCDITLWDKRLSNEAGFAWTKDLKSINPEYYNICEPKIKTITDHGIVLGINGAWGFYIKLLGLEKMKKHFRYMIARWAAYPVIWILAGETTYVSYDLNTLPDDDPKVIQWAAEANTMWSEVLRYLKETDPFHRMVTTHTMHGKLASEELNKSDLLDFDAFQCGIHDENYDLVGNEVKSCCIRARQNKPIKPYVNEETCYEQMLYRCGPNVQRWIFWHSMLGGCAGWTYGACGLFDMSHEEDPFGTSVYGVNWGECSWQEAYQFEGGKEVSRCRKYLNKYEWWKLQPAQDKVVNADGIDAWQECVAAEIPGKVLISYFYPHVSLMTMYRIQGTTFRNLKPGDRYQIFVYNPIRDYEKDLGEATVTEEGLLFTPKPWTANDWVYVAEKI